MLTEICGYLKNWFTRRPDGTDYPKYEGEVTISDGAITTGDVTLLDGQFFRICGSILNDGVWEYSQEKGGNADLKDEVFTGEIWSMAVPSDVRALAEEIAAWRAKYENVDSPAMSPFNSESFGGYSYSKSSGQSNADGSSSGGTTWQSMFAGNLTRYKKL